MSAKVDREMKKAVSSGVFPAADLLVAKNGEEIFHGRYGDAREGSCFDIASITKPICTATLCMMLVEEGLIKLEDSVYQWLGGAREPHHKQMLISNLLEHTSGLPRWQPYYRELPLDLVGTGGGEKFLLESCFGEPLVCKPGEKTIYSDVGYILLGEVIEQAAGAPLDVLFANRIARPLNLTETFFVRSIGKPSYTGRRTFATSDQHVPTPKSSPPEKRGEKKRRFMPTEDCPWRERVIHGEVHDQNTYALGGVSGQAGLFSTASDVNQFVYEFVRCYFGESDWIPQGAIARFINKERFSKLSSRRKSSKGEETFFGGWNIPSVDNSSSGHYFSNESIGHLGYTGCSLWLDLKKKFWVVLLSNRIHPSITNEKIRGFRPLIHDLIYEELLKRS